MIRLSHFPCSVTTFERLSRVHQHATLAKHSTRSSVVVASQLHGRALLDRTSMVGVDPKLGKRWILRDCPERAEKEAQFRSTRSQRPADPDRKSKYSNQLVVESSRVESSRGWWW